MDDSPRKTPPKKKKKVRRINGMLMDVATAAIFVGTTPKAIRGQVERRLIPFKRLGGPVILSAVSWKSFSTRSTAAPSTRRTRT